MKTKLKIIIPAAVAVIAVIIAMIFIKLPEAGTVDTDSLMSTAQKYLVEMNFEQAIAEFEKIIELEPNNVDAYLGLAQAYEALGDLEKAGNMRNMANEILYPNYAADNIDNALETMSDEMTANTEEKKYPNEYDENGVLRHEYIVYGDSDIIAEEKIYDKNGSLISRTDYDEDGSKTEYCEYNKYGNRVYIEHYKNGIIKYIEEYAYYGDTDTEQWRKWFTGEMIPVNEWYYDESGVQIKEVRYNDDGMLSQIRECKNIDGKSVEIKWTDYFEDRITKITEYNDDGLCIGWTSYYEDGSIQNVSEYLVVGDESFEVKQTAYLEDSSLLMIVEYDVQDGKRMGHTYTNYKDGKVRYINYYDENGEKYLKEYYNDMGEVERSVYE